jgi:5-methylcytosine-specific restriction endonuclease McrA
MAIQKEMVLIWKHIRMLWTKWSPTRRALLTSNVVKVPKVKADGTESKIMVNHWKCWECGELVTDREVDHVDPVGRQPTNERELAAAVERLFCDMSNLSIKCKKCHRAKSKTDVKTMREEDVRLDRKEILECLRDSMEAAGLRVKSRSKPSRSSRSTKTKRQ